MVIKSKNGIHYSDFHSLSAMSRSSSTIKLFTKIAQNKANEKETHAYKKIDSYQLSKHEQNTYTYKIEKEADKWAIDQFKKLKDKGKF